MPKTKEANVLSDNNTHLLAFTPEVLRDLARNDAAPWDYRKAAVEVLVNKKHPYSKHEDLRELVHELNVEISDIVFEHPAISGPGPLTSGVTTQTLYGAAEEAPDLEPSPIPDDQKETTDAPDVKT